MSLKTEWLGFCRQASTMPADIDCGTRKIVRDVKWSIEKFDNSLSLADIGFTKQKMSMLKGYYLNQESIKVALEIWNKRVESGKYGSAGISTYNHYKKGKSNMGPCIQAIVFTNYKNKKQPQVSEMDVYYRTTEVLKKFPADLVFIRDEIFPLFNTEKSPIIKINFYFSNLTYHPMYWITTVPHLKHPDKHLERIKVQDRDLWKKIVKWSSRYTIPKYHNGIEKFAQALRTGEQAVNLIDKKKLKTLTTYLKTSMKEIEK